MQAALKRRTGPAVRGVEAIGDSEVDAGSPDMIRRYLLQHKGGPSGPPLLLQCPKQCRDYGTGVMLPFRAFVSFRVIGRLETSGSAAPLFGMPACVTYARLNMLYSRSATMCCGPK